jgi:hypothetical protein
MVLMTPQAGIIENVVARAVHLAVKNGVELLPMPAEIKKKNGGFAAAGKVLNRVGDSGGSRFDEMRKRRVQEANKAILAQNVNDNVIVINED